MIFGRAPDATSLTCITTGAGSQKSIAVTAAGFGGGTSASHCTTTFDGQFTTGALVSCTVRVWVQLALLPARSAAVQVQVITLLHEEVVLLSVQVKLTGTLPSMVSMRVT